MVGWRQELAGWRQQVVGWIRKVADLDSVEDWGARLGMQGRRKGEEVADLHAPYDQNTLWSQGPPQELMMQSGKLSDKDLRTLSEHK